MPFLSTLAECRPLVRSRAGVQRVKSIDDTDLNPWIVEAYGELYHAYVDGGQPYFEKESDLPITVAGKLDVPTDMLALRRVDFLTGGRPLELPDLDVHEVALEQSNTTTSLGRAIGFRLRALELQLPRAAVGQSYRVVYVPTPILPIDVSGNYLDATTMDFVTINGRKWVVLRAAMSCLQKQREDTMTLAAEAAAIFRVIEQHAAKRKKTGLGRIADVASDLYEDPYLSPLGRGWPR